MIHRSALAAAVALCAAAPVSAATYSVSPAGSDSNNGTSAPFGTLSKALSVLRDGDSVVLRGGTYSGGVSLSRANVTLESYPGELATISVPSSGSVTSTLTLGAGAVGTRLRGLKIVGGSYYSLKIDGDRRDKNTLIEDCVIGGSGRDCVKITPGADGLTFRRCEIAFSGLRDASNAEGIDNVCADRLVVQDCWVHDIATNGIYPKGGARETLIERTRIENCGGGGIMLGFWTDTEWFDRTENPRMFENLDGMVRNCVIVNTKGAGIGLYSSQNARVYNNTLVNVGQSVHPAVILSLGNSDAANENLRFINNVVVQPGSASQPMVGVRAGAYEGPAYWSSNRYWRNGASAVFSDDGWTGDLNDWQARTSSDAGSSEGDPRLDAAGIPLTGSGCIDRALSLADVAHDFRGTLRVGAPDIGAFELSGGSTPVAPAAPAVLTATASTGRVDVSWPESALATGYNLYRSTSQAGSFTRVSGEPIAGGSYGDTAVTAGSTYWYRVTAVNAAGESGPSPTASATVPSAPPSDPPTDPPPAGDLAVYDDGLRQGWSARKWRADVSLGASNPVAEGSKSISLAITRKDGYLLLSGGSVATTGKTVLRFFLHGGKRGDQELRVRAFVAGEQQPSVNLWSYGGRPVGGDWVECVVPLEALGIKSGDPLTGLKFSAGRAESRGYLDHIRLE